MYSYVPPHMTKQKQDDQLKPTYSSSVPIRDVALKTCQKRWMIGGSGNRGSGISVLAARHDYDDIYIYIYIYISYHAISTDISDLLSLHLPIVHCFRQILRATSRIGKELLYVGLNWTSCLCSSMWRGLQEYITYELIPTSPAVSCMSGSSNFDSFRDGW